MAQNKAQEGDGLFVGGANSDLQPVFLSPTQYSRSVNTVNRGGKLQCRPGYRCLSAWPAGRLQGFTIFRPRRGEPVLVFVVSGLVYTSLYPFKEYRALDGLQFSETARQVFFAHATKALQRNEDRSLELIEPRNLLIIQDGGFSSAGVFDGTTASHSRGTGAIPIGGPMAWSGDRLWVARFNEVFAGDLADPTSFTEALYITTTASFIFKSEVTALYPVNSGASVAQLLVFTRDNTEMLQSGVRLREQWISISDFQREVLPTIGCVSDRSVVAHGGYLWWFSRYGLVSFDSASQAFVTSAIPYLDQEMSDSKTYLSSDLSGVACSVHENYLLVSVPYAHEFNIHTWVLDNSPMPTKRQVIPSWNSVWTGTRPAQWFSGVIMGRERVFYISPDSDGTNRLWEAFTPDRRDDGCEITWWAELRGFSAGSPAKYKEFRYADLGVSELSGLIDFAVFWAGSSRGKYKRILTKRMWAARGMMRFGRTFRTSTRMFSLKRQSRYIRTADARSQSPEEDLSSCGIENPYVEFKDDSFQLLVVGSGPSALSNVLLYFSDADQLDDSGKCEKDETEEGFVRFDGAAVKAETIDDAESQFDAGLSSEPELFFAARAETVTAEGFTEVGVGEHTTPISQQCAEKVASSIARRMAASALETILPERVSQGIL